ncbi:MAG: ABC transporter ATP-binding protein [Planctomycetaceae bacterium]
MLDFVIRAVGLRKSYGAGAAATEVLRGVDLSVARGECLFLAGPSGSGKTTLLSILGCVLTPDDGTLLMLGENVSSLSAAQRARFRRERIGFVFQRFHLFAALTALENVIVPCDLQGVSRSNSRRRGRELLERVGLSDRADYRVTQLSMGQKQRVALARALAGDPDIVLADEPTASLDAESGLAAMQLLRQLCSDLQKTVVVVTHDNRIFSLADRILKLADGRIVAGQLAERTRFAERSGVLEYGAA